MRRTRQTPAAHRLVAGLPLFLAALWVADASAQMYSVGKRADTWEGTVGIYMTASETSDGANGSSIDVDDGWGLALSLAYNWTEHFALRFDGSWSRPDYSAVFVTDEEGPVSVNHTLTLFNGQLSGVWNILEGPFTPYVQAGMGWSYIDSNVADGPPVTGCWWDPWWGYICSGFYSTYSDTSFSWNVGAGLRYDFNRDMFLRGGYELNTIDGNSGADPSFDAFRIELGWKF